MTPPPAGAAGHHPSTPVVRLDHASIGYGERPTVRDVSLQIDPHEVVALVGANGSGKSTLVKGLLGLATVMSGAVDLFGVPRQDLRQRWRVGYVPQRHTVGGAIPSTVEEVVTSGRLPRKRFGSRLTGTDREAVRAAIETVGLSDQRAAAVSTLSGGQQRRVLVARALASEPEMLIMDEPTAGVDREQQDRLAVTLARLVEGGLTLLIVTHELQALAPVLTRVVTLEAGRVLTDVPADASVATPGVTAPGDCAHGGCRAAVTPAGLASSLGHPWASTEEAAR